MTDLCQFLPWDSDFFQRRIARVRHESLNERSVEQVLAWCAAERIDLLYLLVNAGDLETVRLAEQRQFRLMDIRLTLKIKPPEQPAVRYADIRPHQPSDLPALKAIARVSHRDSRFYADDSIPPEQSDRLYETWVENSANGFADQVLVAVDGTLPVGYITCHLEGDQGKIGLLGVSAAAQGKGFGTMLIDSALEWFRQQGVSKTTVVTQGRNIRAQRVYQRRGFMTKFVHLWYHRWF